MVLTKRMKSRGHSRDYVRIGANGDPANRRKYKEWQRIEVNNGKCLSIFIVLSNQLRQRVAVLLQTIISRSGVRIPARSP